MKEYFLQSKNGGYTIIETMIAVSLFLVVVMSGMGALLNANLLHNKAKDMRSIMDNLNFAMEDMSRNLRTGYNYHCITSNRVVDYTTPLSCEEGNGRGIAFISALDQQQWVYYIDDGVLKKSKAGGADGSFVPISIPNEVVIDQGSFVVLGAEPPVDSSSPAERQPLVTIRLAGHIDYKGVITPFSLQTSVSQRNIDI